MTHKNFNTGTWYNGCATLSKSVPRGFDSLRSCHFTPQGECCSEVYRNLRHKFRRRSLKDRQKFPKLRVSVCWFESNRWHQFVFVFQTTWRQSDIRLFRVDNQSTHLERLRQLSPCERNHKNLAQFHSRRGKPVSRLSVKQLIKRSRRLAGANFV